MAGDRRCAGSGSAHDRAVLPWVTKASSPTAPQLSRLGSVRASDARVRSCCQAGQTLVEFALVLPILFLLVMALLELALGFQSFMALNRASQEGAHLASIMGNQLGADCLILTKIEEDVAAPNRRSNINKVVIERTALAGNVSYAQQEWDRTGQTVCTLPDGTNTIVPYTLTVAGYPEDQRCPALAGCPSLDPPRSTVDNIGVRVQYRHEWVTPLSAILDVLPGGRSGWTFTQRNIFRIEPVL
jgi:Flp pilus assembly protein TadG